MAHFFTAALPFIAIGLAIALLAANARRGRERKNYLTEGMCLGLALGAGLSGLLQMELGLAMSLGLLLGAALGQLVPKGEVDKTEEEERDHGED